MRTNEAEIETSLQPVLYFKDDDQLFLFYILSFKVDRNRSVISQDFSCFHDFFLQISLCLKIYLKEEK